jgi:hypothetical protein
MKAVWKVIKYALLGVALLFLLLLASLIPDYVYYMPRAQPPPSATNLETFFEWMPDPKWADRVTVSNMVYYQFFGPAGRWKSSGPSAYTFDESGRFVGWTKDCGDFYTPQIVYSPGAKREQISVDNVRALIRTNTPFESTAKSNP